MASPEETLMENLPSISVIVPFFNSRKTLDRCLNSILAQTYKNFELIAVNDGSTDNSLEIVSSYAEKDNRIKIVNKAHKGVSSARNKALEVATGDLIQFVDADDDIEPDMFETAVSLMDETGADIVVCNHDHPCIMNYFGDSVLDFTDKKNIWRFYQNTFAGVVPWNKLYKREIITEKFDEEISFTEDDIFCLSNMANAKKIAGTSKVLYHYFVAPPTTNPDELSCINKMAKAKDFWQTKNTFWYMRDKLLPKTKEIAKRRLPREYAEDIIYTRIFDFMPWEIVILGSLDVDRYGLIKEMQNIFREKDFKKSLALKEKYGVYFKELLPLEQDIMVEKFIDMSLFARYKHNGKSASSILCGARYIRKNVYISRRRLRHSRFCRKSVKRNGTLPQRRSKVRSFCNRKIQYCKRGFSSFRCGRFPCDRMI